MASRACSEKQAKYLCVFVGNDINFSIFVISMPDASERTPARPGQARPRQRADQKVFSSLISQMHIHKSAHKQRRNLNWG